MKNARKLSLKKEVLNELTSDELGSVVGGTHQCMTIPPLLCLSVQQCNVTHQAECLAPSVLPQTCTC